MSELRQDPFTGAWVAIAYERAAREGALEAPQPAPHPNSGTCVFCPGAEGQTPPELERLRLADDAEPWRVRVVPNRFPAFSPDARTTEAAAPAFQRQPGFGSHEVVVETPRHGEGFVALSPAHATLVLQAWQHRLSALASLRGIAAVVAFKNEGPLAGASQAHAHSQLIAMGTVPPRLAVKVARASEHGRSHTDTLWGSVLAAERAAATRIVAERPGVVALAPFAARWPYETWLIPADMGIPFGALPRDRLEPIATLVQAILRAIAQVEGPFSFNLLVVTPPIGAEASLPWHIELVPRCIQPGGFELSTELQINPIPPELGAQRLRAALEPSS